MKKVINGEAMICLEVFDEKDTSKILKKYNEDGRWSEVELDCDGDIILFE